MSATDTFGTFEPNGDHIDVRFERHYPRPVETVWSALTEPARLADWMGVANVEPHVGGRFELMADGTHPMIGRVRIWDPPCILEFSWSNIHAPESVVRYELADDGSGGTRLVFTHQGMPYANSALMLPGWHDFLDHLEGVLMGTPQPVDLNGWRKRQTAYVRHYDLRNVKLTP